MTQRSVALVWLFDIIDRLPIRYVRDRVVFKHRDARIVAFFPGTNVPCEIDAGACKAGQLVYVEQWWCCGEYGCSNPDGSGEQKKRKTKSSRCGARMRVRVFATAERGECVCQVEQDQDVMHGEAFERPESTPLGRYDWRSKVILAQAAADGVDNISDVLVDDRWNPERIPRPATRKEKDSLRNRFKQVLKKHGRTVRRRTRYEDEVLDEDDEAEDEEKRVELEEEEQDDEEDSQQQAAVERILDCRDAADEREYLVKWVGWPSSSNTWSKQSELLHAQDKIDAFHRSHSDGAGGPRRENAILDDDPNAVAAIAALEQRVTSIMRVAARLTSAQPFDEL